MTWAQLQQNSDYQSIKERLSLAAVVLENGVALEQRGDRLVGRCPFHNDNGPSFSVWRTEEGDELCGCWSCDFRPSDVYTFIQRIRGVNFTQAAKIALAYLTEGLPDAPDLPEHVYDVRESRVVVAEAVEPTHAVLEFLHDRHLPIDDAWLVAEFKLAVNRDGDIVIPHYGTDGELHAAKRRSDGGKPITVPGGRLDALYGVWRDRGRRRVILCEGESDTWLTAWGKRDDDVDVLGLPSGVSAKPKDEWIDHLRGRDVTLLFDADDAGRRGAAMWALALFGAADSIKVASLADGMDACKAGLDDVMAGLQNAYPYVDLASLAISEVSGRYLKINLTTGAANDLSDFVFEVVNVIEFASGEVTYFTVIAGEKELQLSTETLSDSNKLRKWCANRMLIWKGSGRDASELQERLKALATFVPRYEGTDVTGLHGGTFVLPDGVVGGSRWRYVSEGTSVRCADYTQIHQGPFDRTTILTLAHMHAPSVMTPLLGWVAAAPLRSICPQFPILAVVGGAGYGKTTLVQTLLRAFSYWQTAPMTLSSTTAHAVQSLVASTNAFPIWFDEYRLGARPVAKLALDQAIRDAWDGSASVKGGYGDNKVQLKYLSAIAPIMITGEDAFSETSHAERMIILSLGKDGRNADALAYLESLDTTGLGYDYLRWLTARAQQDDFPAPPKEHDRHRQAVAVARWGYELLNEYAYGSLPEWDSSLVESEFDEISKRSPYLEALAYGYELRDYQGNEVVWLEDDAVCVRVKALLGLLKSSGVDITLPGGSAAMIKWLSQQWDTDKELRGHRGMYISLRDAKASIFPEIR